MAEWICSVCGYVYNETAGDPANGIPPGTPFSQIPEDWTCPKCRAGKAVFRPLTAGRSRH